MIINIKDKTTQDIYDGVNSKKSRKIPVELHSKCRRLLDQLNASFDIDDMRIPPGNMLEALTGNLNEYWSVRINNQWRIIFKWDEDNSNALDVFIGDYH